MRAQQKSGRNPPLPHPLATQGVPLFNPLLLLVSFLYYSPMSNLGSENGSLDQRLVQYIIPYMVMKHITGSTHCHHVLFWIQTVLE